MRFLLFVNLLLLITGCSEGTKPNPLPRAGAPAPPQKELPPPMVNGKTLYERLGREDGLVRTVDALVVGLNSQSKTRGLAASLKKRALVEFLMEVSSRPRPKLADDVMLTAADWSLVIPALRTTLAERGVPDADRDELVANIEKSR